VQANNLIVLNIYLWYCNQSVYSCTTDMYAEKEYYISMISRLQDSTINEGFMYYVCYN
jgi:hypothetical protein